MITLSTETHDASTSQRGLTTVELLAVLVLVALMTVVAAPALRRALERAELDAAADATASHVRQARLLALKSRAPHRVALAAVGGRLSLELQREEGGSFVAIPDRTVSFEPSIVASPSATVIGVDRRGRCDARRIVIAGERSGLHRSLAIDPSCAISKE